MAESGQATEKGHGTINNNLSENCVGYYIFLIDPRAQTDSKKQLSRLEDLRKSALQLTARLTSDYIWQRGSFNLDLATDKGLAYLRGTTDYGESIEDEWLIVYILRELSKSYPTAWIRLFDADGEFLLIEAANVLPKWLSPENDQNRVWINNGCLRIIPHTPDLAPKSKQLTLSDAVNVIKASPDSLIHSEFIEAEAFYRLEKYPDQIQKSLHHSLVTIPRKLAYVLHQIPKAIAPAVESFYIRDAFDMRDLLSRNSALQFPPDDFVTLSVKFTRVLFAQLRSQRFEPPAPWASMVQGATGISKTRLEMGMKLACGFEIMLNNIDKTDSREAREASIVVEDLKEDGDSVLPGDDEIAGWTDSRREDDESWLDINFEDFEMELEGRKGGSHAKSNTGFGDATTQADLRKIVSRFEAFLNDESAGLEGAEVEEMDIDDDLGDDEEDSEDDEDEDKAVSFDEAEFSRMMREMMGLAPVAADATPKSGKTSETAGQLATQSQDDDTDNEPDNEELQELTNQLEAELNEHGALKIGPPGHNASTLTDKEQKREKIDDRSSDGVDGRLDDGDEGADWLEDDENDVNIDYNLAKNLLESFKGQAGLPGPAGNILGMMGLQLPRDEDDNDSPRDKAR
ncbi:ecdysoneless-like protein [Colletotrichum chlorophyti]|uniref:Ecdysoneless-like protein n=1 Tax=Colletotrichum chlorophyti TaxID=708187 RepID=A0A1Q8S155_9PEZI|nr:ecdysoneless-like protein [Colletotrichum chlorophyti]